MRNTVKLTDGKVTIVKATFSRSSFKKLTEKELGKLSKTARDLLHFFETFWSLCNIHDNVYVYLLEVQIQKTEKYTCGLFQLCFYENLFGPPYDSPILSHETLKKNIVQILLNELFSLNKDTNKRILKKYIVNANVEYC